LGFPSLKNSDLLRPITGAMQTCSPLRPRSLRCLRKPLQPALSSLAPSQMPRISRYPSPFNKAATRYGPRRPSCALERCRRDTRRDARPRSAGYATPRSCRRMMTKLPDGRYAFEIAPGGRIARWNPPRDCPVRARCCCRLWRGPSRAPDRLDRRHPGPG
jgi:hypothetical protein